MNDPDDVVALSERLQLALRAGGLGTWGWDKQSGSVEWDDRVLELFDMPTDAFAGTWQGWLDAIHPMDRAEVERTIDDAVATCADYSLRHRIVRQDGSVRWLAASGHITVNEQGDTTGIIGCIEDVTELVLADDAHREVAEMAVALAASEQRNRIELEFLAAINDLLSRCLSRSEVLTQLPDVVVSRLADWCGMFVSPGSDPDQSRSIPDMEAAAADPDLRDAIRALYAGQPWDPDAPTGLGHVIAQGRSELVTRIDDTTVDQLALDNSALFALDIRSSMLVPLVKRGRPIGALHLLRRSQAGPFDDEDLALAEAAAARIASSLTNLRLTEHERHIAVTLQQALLPDELPRIPGVSIAARYRASGPHNEVGGDFYDVFGIAENCWALVVGDVSGKGPGAASYTSLARHSIRMSAWHGDAPDAVLAWLNRALASASGTTFCTAAYATIQPLADGVLELACALGGHPQPIICRADGKIEVFGTCGTILGAFPENRSTVATTLLAAGDTVVLYTDGVTDVPPPYDLGNDELCELVGSCWREASDGDDLAERILAAVDHRLALTERGDDIALLVVNAV